LYQLQLGFFYLEKYLTDAKLALDKIGSDFAI
jgi:hypothetical protein